jgi:hypothetical protein
LVLPLTLLEVSAMRESARISEAEACARTPRTSGCPAESDKLLLDTGGTSVMTIVDQLQT